MPLQFNPHGGCIRIAGGDHLLERRFKGPRAGERFAGSMMRAGLALLGQIYLHLVKPRVLKQLLVYYLKFRPRENIWPS